MNASSWSRATALAACLFALGCGAGHLADDLSPFSGVRKKVSTSGPAFRVHWVRELAPMFGGRYVPVERAGAAIDTEHGFVYVGSSQRTLWALRLNGEQVYHYDVPDSIEATPTLDADHDELYLATSSGAVHALQAREGKLRFKVDAGGSISKPGVLSEDALYVVTDDDAVIAFSRADGSVLWRYKRDPRAGLQVDGHAGLLMADHRLITGFTDGTIAALSPGDGHVLWSIDTTLDFADPAQTEKGFVDIDTTPVQVNGMVYAASFLGGFYGIEASHGAVQIRNPELTGIVGIVNDDNALILASARGGIACLELPSLELRWRHPIHEGAPGAMDVEGRTVFVAQTRGAFIALKLADGSEQGRLQTAHGFAAAPSMQDGYGFILGNTGTFYAFGY